ncbi:hypothetical protein KIN20_022311 [Parelaphostrongylus tenuis]|uniref:Uncharacterized protein n=1 Tax=Parelaphostrongylus tenuis TaxID=148309 RepID=A0AAD5QV99_PARTN|nr:hypothetical protein KIN20_022311 [Parelaphostrongylus tenuis]
MENHRNASKRLPREKREAVLRLCRYDTELEHKVVDESNNQLDDMVVTPPIPRPYFILENVGPSVETLFKSDRNKYLPVHTSIFLTIGCIQTISQKAELQKCSITKTSLSSEKLTSSLYKFISLYQSICPYEPS